MVLNPDCVRDVLLCVEHCGFGERMNLAKLQERLPDYTEEDLWYTCIKLEEGGYLDLMTAQYLRMPIPSIKQINDLTYSGHEFLNIIREQGTWDKVKCVAKKVGSFSLKTLSEIAQEVSKAAVTSALQSLL